MSDIEMQVQGYLGCFNGLPDKISARIERQDSLLKYQKKKNPNIRVAEWLIMTSKKWSQKDTVTVAFKGGDYNTRKAIYDAALHWDKHINLMLDFGYNSRNREFRSWSATDKESVADIKICFDQDGYWSTVGTDCTTRVRSNEASMCFQFFDVSLPSNHISIVIHEFGHALGFEHEHQSPNSSCQADFRWEDDENYRPTVNDLGIYIQDSNGNRPGLYTYFSGKPNEWPRYKVKHNLGQLRNSSAYDFSAFDNRSIMRYVFPESYFVDARNSDCYINWDPQRLSELDIEGANHNYPLRTNLYESRALRNKEVLSAYIDTPTLDFGAKKELVIKRELAKIDEFM